MKEGAEMLMRHIDKDDCIFIMVDPDVDGFTSAAVLINYLWERFPSLNIKYALHNDKAHGIVLAQVPEEAKLVIAPDSSSSDFEIHKILSERGVDVLVLDHHEAEKVSPHACVINNQLCDYPNKSLSGVGIVYKFCCYLDDVISENLTSNIKLAEKFLDLVALGLIADMVPITEYETRRLIDKGLAQVANPFFAAMCEKNAFNMKGEITPISVAFSIAPFINAANRLGTQKEKQVIFEAMLERKAREKIKSTKRGAKPGDVETILEQACRSCSTIKSRQTKARDAQVMRIEGLIEQQHLLDNRILFVTCEDKVNENLTGLIANQLMAEYQRPVVLLNKFEDCLRGSGRTYGLPNFRQFLNDTQLVNYCEGHASAFGISVDEKKLQELIDCTHNLLKDYPCDQGYTVDCIYDYKDVDIKDILEIGRLSHLWGQGMPEPLIAIENIPVTKKNITLLSPDKNPTLKIVLPNGLSLMKFKATKDELDPKEGEFKINIVGTCAINEWMGNITPQIIIKDYEITYRCSYYF